MTQGIPLFYPGWTSSRKEWKVLMTALMVMMIIHLELYVSRKGFLSDHSVHSAMNPISIFQTVWTQSLMYHLERSWSLSIGVRTCWHPYRPGARVWMKDQSKTMVSARVLTLFNYCLCGDHLQPVCPTVENTFTKSGTVPLLRISSCAIKYL